MSAPPSAPSPQRDPATDAARSAPSGYRSVLLFGCAILLISTGVRSSFGLFMPEMVQARDWSRETFSFAIAVQNLMWGLGGSFLGAMADKYGSMRTLLLGAALYVVGFIGMAFAETGLELTLSAGLLIGVAVGGTSFGIILATLGRVVPPDKRSLAFGIGVASGSLGQFLFLPLADWLIRHQGWHNALLWHAAIVGLVLILALGVKGGGTRGGGASVRLGEALRMAGTDRNFHLLFWGYFVCGLQIMFLALHLPAYLIDKGLPAQTGATAIALVGLFNVVGSFSAGLLGQRYSKKWLLAGMYVLRSLICAAFLLTPLSVMSVYVFAAATGLLWLSTVPVTNALVGQMYGVRYLGLLGGVVFFGHQIGSFLGAWLGGRLFDTMGNYDAAWAIYILFGFFAAFMHAPIDQRPVSERTPSSAAA
ncbi:MAG: hypothetical protein RLZZ153_2587 [Pseudomonadota bacterium]